MLESICFIFVTFYEAFENGSSRSRRDNRNLAISTALKPSCQAKSSSDMPMSTIHSAPALDSFTPLVEHQTQTPTTFYDARPILHFHAKNARAVAYGDYIKELPFFAEGPAQNTDAAAVETVDAYISTE